MLKTLYTAAPRCSELGRMRFENIDFEQGEGRDHWIMNGKGGRDR